MANCHRCKQELATGTDCRNEACTIYRIKNLYFNLWFMSKGQIESRLADIDVPWKRCGKQFFFFVTPETIHDVRSKISGLNQENGSILFESKIDYVFSSPEEIEQQIRDSWGPGEPIIIRSYPSGGHNEVQRSDSLGNDR